MQLRTRAEFADPGELLVTIILTGRLEGFEKLRRAIGLDTPFYEIDNLVNQIDDVSRRLRGKVEAAPTPGRRMVEGDL